MAYDEQLAARTQDALAGTAGLTTRRMFGGLCYLVHGHMAAGIVGSTLMLRVGPGAYDEALTRPDVRPMDFTGRPMRGMIYVDPPGIGSAAALRRWLDAALEFVATLPPKAPPGPPRPRKRRQA